MRLTELKLPLDHTDAELRSAVLARLGIVADDLLGYTIFRRSHDARKPSANITLDNLFNSPDGLAFDSFGRMWIQTDGNFSNTGVYAGQGNNKLLCADPVTGEIRRFLVGPSGCEVTDYFHQLMRDTLLASGRVSFHPMSELVGEPGRGAYAIRSLLSEDILPGLALPRGVSSSVSTLSYYSVLFLGLFAALAAAGFQVGELAIIFGALGVGIGFGL